MVSEYLGQVFFLQKPFNGAGSIEFTRFPWPSVSDLDLQSHDLENLFTNAHSYDGCLCKVSLKSLRHVQRYRITPNGDN